MLSSELVFLTPAAALVGLAFALPLGALLVREHRARRVRSDLGLTSPGGSGRLLRAGAILAAAALVSTTAAQPALRDTDSSRMRSDAEAYLTFDVTRSMLARPSLAGIDRLDRARRLAVRLQRGLADVPTGVATVTNRMMPLLFPTRDRRGVAAVVDHSLEIMQPPPALVAAPRATALGAIGLAADRTYFSRGARRRALVVFSDLDTDGFSLGGTLRDLRRHRIEPFLIRVAEPGERIFGPTGQVERYRSVSTLSVPALRAAGWPAYEERELGRAIADLHAYLGSGPTAPSGVVDSQRNLAGLCAVGALLAVAALVLSSLLAGLVRARVLVS